MTYITTIFIQLGTMVLGIFAGFLTSWLASEELQKYKKITASLIMVLCVLTLLSPLTLFLTTENKDAFFVSSVFFFITVGLVTVKACSSHVKENMLQLRKELFMEIVQHKVWFVGMSIVVYGGLYFFSRFM
jgi:small basic protein